MEFNLLIALFFGLPQIHRREANPPAWVATPPSIRVQPKSCDNGVTGKIQVRAVVVARLLIMDEQRGYCSAPRRASLRTCTPPAVVSQCFPLEKIRIIRARLVDKGQRHLLVEVDTPVIVPVILRRLIP